ncbi:thioredoxin-disulfide reductase [Candidatus Saccharibacteria bacterium]|nr:thioredoxin-disulfide reductase [Candidatus Saccharibacteria bacterium]
MYDVVIIGAGPAGLTAAIYTRRAAKKVLVLEAKVYGGQIVNTLDIENYPAEEHISGYDFATKLYNQAKNLGAEIVFEKVISIEANGKQKKVITTDNVYEAGSVIIATGSENKKLGLPNEDQLIGKGISYCATCDGAFYKNKKVAVVGGGNTALEDALYLADVAEKVYLIHRRSEFRGEDSMVSRLKGKENIQFVLNSNVTKLNAGNKLESIEVASTDGKMRTIEIDGLFVAIGRIPESKAFANLIKLDDAGYIEADEKCHTNVDGIFVAGDSRTKDVRQLVTAVSDGAIAATEAVKYIGN